MFKPLQTLKQLAQLKLLSSNMSTTPLKRTFILDFDSTITTADTINTLFTRVLTLQSSRGLNFTSAHAEILSAYSADYKTHISSYKPVKADRQTLKEEIDWQRSLRDVEVKSFERVSKSGIFKGISLQDWKTLGREAVDDGDVGVRDGFWTCDRLAGIDGLWGIVSVNFSKDFITGVINTQPSTNFGKCLEICANCARIDGVVEGPKLEVKGSYDTRMGDQRVGEVLATSDSKLNAMNALIERWKSQGHNLGAVVYVGDSGTDIECLVDPGVIGIIMSPDEKGGLMETMKKVQVEVVHVEGFSWRRKGVLWWARDFGEVFRSELYG